MDRKPGDDVTKNLEDDHDAVTTHIIQGPGDDSVAAPQYERIGAYRVIQREGQGGMGAIYLAVRDDEQYQKQVAIKVIKRGMDTDEIVRRFRRERQILASLDHPNICRLIDGGATAGGLPYFVMEYIQGKPLEEYCADHKLGLRERLKLFRTICSAVQYAHQNLVIHRDLKPGNILVTADGVPKLLDFGLGKLLDPAAESGTAPLTAADMVLMTPEYASPEQARGDPITTASDVYSLGVILYELLTGSRPYKFTTRNQRDIVHVITEHDPGKPSSAITQKLEQSSESPVRLPDPAKLQKQLRGDLDNIVLMALRKEPQHRYQSAEALSEDIGRYLESLPVHARKATAGYRAIKFIRRHKIAVTVATSFAMILIAFTIAMAIQARKISIQAGRIAQERDKAQQVSNFLKDIFRTSDPSLARGNTITAREILDQGAARIASEFKNQPDVRASLMDTIGTVYRSLGLYDKAKPLLEESLNTRKQLYGPRSPEVAESLNHVGDLWKDSGNYGAAETRYREALSVNRSLFGVESLQAASDLADLSYALDLKAQYPEAERLARESLAIRKKLLGNDDPEVAQSLLFLAYSLNDKGDFAGAEPLYREALAIRQKVLGNDHPETGDALNDLGLFLARDKGDYATAEPLLRQTLAIRRKTLGNNHPDVATALNNLGSLLNEKGDDASAELLFREALSITRTMFGNDHPLVASDLNNLAGVLWRRGDYPQAEALLREVVNITRKTLGNEHPDTAKATGNLAVLLRDKGDLAAAEPMFRTAMAIDKKTLGKEHPDVAIDQQNLALLLSDKKDYAAAEPLYREALSVLQKALGKKHPTFAAVQRGLCELLIDTDRANEALPLIEEALSIQKAALPAGSPQIESTQSVLGKCLASMGRLQEAEPLLVQSYQNLSAQKSAGRAARDARKRLNRFYAQSGNKKKAEEYN